MQSMILGIDGGATATRAALSDSDGKVFGPFHAPSSNAVLHTESELREVMLKIQGEVQKILLRENKKLKAVALCLAGVINEKIQAKVHRVASPIWPGVPILISHDLMSSLFSGAKEGQGVAVISGTGASVFGRTQNAELKVGGWGHILGDTGGAYHLAHMSLRSIAAAYDRDAKPNLLAKELLKHLKLKNIQDLSAYISTVEKARIADLTKALFAAVKKGDKSAKNIISIGASGLASNVVSVIRRLKLKNVPIVLTGGVFEKQPAYVDAFTKQLRKSVRWARPFLTNINGAIGAIEWAKSELAKKGKSKKSVQKIKSNLDLKAPLEFLDLNEISTEDQNPRTKNLSELETLDAVKLMIEEDSVLPRVLSSVASEIAKGVDLIANAFKNDGHLIYVGAGTSGRLGVLDASECPPTFRSPPEQVQGIIAGGDKALRSAVEGAEDNIEMGMAAVLDLKLTKLDVVCGIAASGRTPFVLSALDTAKKLGAKTILLTCNPKVKLSNSYDLELHLETGPEVLTGSTRLRAGTATKMVLNMFTTLAMAQNGKVKGNYMVDLNPTNKKLKARALRILMELSGKSKEASMALLEQNHWRLKETLQELNI